jgi:hypothetical protein
VASEESALSRQFETYAAEIDRLKLARSYLDTFAGNFPPTHPGASHAGFVNKLRECHARALDFVSASATRAPYGYGSQITTVMTRIEALGGRIEQLLAQQPALNIEATWADVVFDAIAGIRAIAEQISSDIPVHEKYLVRLADERDASKS